MQNAQSRPIPSSSLPPHFRQIRLELARERGHPEGDPATAYVIVAPLDAEGKIDPLLWKKHRRACRIARLRPDSDDSLGQLVHRPGGAWAFHYDRSPYVPDEVGYHFADERFMTGEYVSIREGRDTHTYRVTSVGRL